MSAMETDFYEILGIERSADAGTIKAAYRKLAMQYHPDRNQGCKENEAKFKAVSAAYECLKDPQKRAAYDRYGHAAFNGSMGGAPGADFGDLGDIFETNAAPTFKVKVLGTAPVTKVSIVRDAKYVHVEQPKTAEVNLAWTDPAPLAWATSYYYVRVEQSDNNLAWASPMWITYRPSASR